MSMSYTDRLIHSRDLAHVAGDLFVKAAKLRKGPARERMEQTAQDFLDKAKEFLRPDAAA